MQKFIQHLLSKEKPETGFASLLLRKAVLEYLSRMAKPSEKHSSEALHMSLAVFATLPKKIVGRGLRTDDTNR